MSQWQGVMRAPFGFITVQTANGLLERVDYSTENLHEQVPADMVAERTMEQLLRWLDDPEYRFDLPMLEANTAFRSRVRQALLDIPVGEVRRYGELAAQLKSSPRAVGGACRTNPISLIVPCHRVVAGNGMGGYGGQTQGNNLGVKHWVLSHEKAII